MKNQARSDGTIKNTSKLLSRLSNSVDLNNPEQVTQFIAQLEGSSSYKRNLCIAYNKYVQYYKLQWEMPRYKQESKQIRIPTKEKLEMIISSCGKTLATKLTISLECGLHPVELCNLKVKDIDLEQRIIYPTTAKHGTPRALKISNKLQMMIQNHITRNNLNPNDKLFKGDSEHYGRFFRLARNRLAKKLQDPSIQQIRLYDFRHFSPQCYTTKQEIYFTQNNKWDTAKSKPHSSTPNYST